MFTTLLARFISVPRVIRFAVLAIFSVLLIVIATRHFWPREVVTTQISTVYKTVEIPVEKLVTKDVIKYVKTEDRTIVEALMKENATLKVTVDRLTVSVAEAQSHGTGVIVPTPDPVTPTVTPSPQPFTFTDWRLKFISDGKKADYTLSQKFIIVNSAGHKDQNNTPVTLVNLYEVGANGERLLIPTVESTTIAATPTVSHWYAKPTVQAGLAVTPVKGSTSLWEKNAVMALPWLKHGEGAVETTRYAVLVPAVTFGQTPLTVGFLPVSLNLGTYRQLFLTDIWISPYVGINPQTKAKKFSFTLTATF